MVTCILYNANNILGIIRFWNSYTVHILWIITLLNDMMQSAYFGNKSSIMSPELNRAKCGTPLDDPQSIFLGYQQELWQSCRQIYT